MTSGYFIIKYLICLFLILFVSSVINVDIQTVITMIVYVRSLYVLAYPYLVRTF